MTQFFYDVFISHAYEDQSEFAGKLALALKRKGLKIWYSGFELTLGTSIAASVNKALCESRHGIVIISPIYLTKSWAMKELESLFGQETEGNRILPVLHGISVSTLKKKLPLLADRYAVSSRTGIDNVVQRVLQVVNGKKIKVKPQSSAKKKGKSSRKKPAATNSSIQNVGVIVLGGKAHVENAAGGNITIRKSKK